MTRFEELKQKYLSGLTSIEEELELTNLLRSGKKTDKFLLSELIYFEEIKNSKPSPGFEQDFKNRILETRKADIGIWLGRIAAGVVLVILGFAGGTIYNFTKKGEDHDWARMQHEIQQLQQISTEALLKQESAHERLKAMVLANTLAQKPDSATLALIFQAYNNDSNVNIRLSALEFLNRFNSDEHVRKQLVNSLQSQDSEIILYKLVYLMRDLKESQALPVLKKLKQSDKISPDLKEEIDNAISTINS